MEFLAEAMERFSAEFQGDVQVQENLEGILQGLLEHREPDLLQTLFLCQSLPESEAGIELLHSLIQEPCLSGEWRARLASYSQICTRAPVLETAAAISGILSDSEDSNARYFAAQALRGAWGELYVAVLEGALNDGTAMWEWWSAYRISNEAAKSIASFCPDNEALLLWMEGRRRELHCEDPTRRELATFVLAELGDEEALALLQIMAEEAENIQAQDLLRALSSS